MRVLVVEDRVGDSVDTVLDIVEAGHQVVRCQPVAGEVEPCAGLATNPSPCPLAAPVDAVVAVRTGEDGFTMRELGVVCAGRAGVPIVSVGRVAPFPGVHVAREDVVRTLERL